MENIAVICVLSAIVGIIVWYLVRRKKRGEKCVSCPYGGQCSRRCGNEICAKKG